MFAAAGLSRTPRKTGSPLPLLASVKVPSEVLPLNACMEAVYAPLVSAWSHAPPPIKACENASEIGPVPDPVLLLKAQIVESPPLIPVPEVVQLQFGDAGHTTASSPLLLLPRKLPVTPTLRPEVALKPTASAV
jgi:hypothetical protein